MRTLRELRLWERDGHEVPPRSLEETRKLVESDAQRMFRYLQAQTSSVTELARDPIKRDTMLRELAQNPDTPDGGKLINYVGEDQDPYAVLALYEKALSTNPKTFEECVLNAFLAQCY